MNTEFKKKLPNILTIFRIILIPIIVGSFYLPWKITNLFVAALFGLAAITDYFDGKFAREFQVQSNFGRCFDPIADKLLVIISLVMLVSYNPNIFLLIPALIIICREVLVSGLREFLAGIKVSVPVTYLAKIKTAFQMTAIACLLLSSKNSYFTYEYIMNFLETETYLKIMFYGLFENFSLILLNISAILTVITGYNYLKVGLKNM